MTSACSESNIRAIVNAMSEGAMVQLANGRICAANPSAERILGYTREQLTQMSTTDPAWHAILEDGSPLTDDTHPCSFSLATGQPCNNVIVGFKRMDGARAWLSVNTVPLLKQDEDSPYAVITTFSDITRIKQHEKKIHELNSLMLAIRRINERLLTAATEEELYHFICDTLHSLEHVVAVWIGLRTQHKSITSAAWAGTDNTPDDLASSISLVEAAIYNCAPIVVQDLQSDQRFAQWQRGKPLNAIAVAAIPLFVDGEAIGGLTLFSDSSSFFNEANIKFLSEVVGDIAVGVRTLRLDHMLQTTLSNLRNSLHATIDAISGIVEHRDPYTAGHERRVAQLACAIGEKMGLPERQIEGLRVAGYIHDLGKIAIPAEILSKPARLTNAERSLVMEHSLTGHNLLKNLQFPWPIAKVALQHHERLDGSGYPHGLKGDEIILEAKILMVADVVEAMSGHRPYRPALGPEKALQEISRNSGKFYETGIVDACIDLFNRHQFAFEERRPDLM